MARRDLGTGKTRALIEAIGKHLAGKETRRVLLCSHTKAAAQTAIARWGDPSPRLDIQTIHSFCFKELKLSRSQTVDDEKLSHFVSEFGLDMEEGGEGRQYVETMSYAACAGIPVVDAYQRSKRPGAEAHFQAFVASYNAWKKQFGYMDFCDMLLWYVQKPARATGHTLLTIDEAQDLTPLHWRVIRKFMEANPGCKVLVAGDDDQCIYGYTGAIAHGAALFAEGTGAQSRVLDQSHRVPVAVHAVANRITARLTNRVPKEYKPRPADGAVVQFGAFHPPIDPGKDSLVLYNDKFVRRDVVEPYLMDGLIPYHAVSGFPAPLQSKAGRALVIAAGDTVDLAELRKNLNERGRHLLETGGLPLTLNRLRARDLSLVQCHWSQEDYLRSVDLTAPVNVRISTIYGAKGMEAADVHLVTAVSQGAVDNSFTDPDALHRLFYVGVTRAAERLFLYDGENAYNIPTEEES